MIQHTKPALHASTLSMLSRCGMQAFYRYVENIKAPPGVAMLIGTAVHRSSEIDLVRKMQTGALASLEEVREVAAAAIDSAWRDEAPVLDDEERALGESTVRARAKDDAVRLTRLHHDEVAPIIQPQAIELRLRIEDPNFKYAIEGTVDVLDKRRILIDRKTSAKSPSGKEAEGNVQLAIYSMMLEAHGTPVDTQALDFLVKNKVAKYVRVSAPAPKDHTPTIARIGAAAKVFETGAFYPVDPSGPSGWTCTAAHCGYFDRCPYGRAARTTHVVAAIPTTNQEPVQ